MTVGSLLICCPVYINENYLDWLNLETGHVICAVASVYF